MTAANNPTWAGSGMVADARSVTTEAGLEPLAFDEVYQKHVDYLWRSARAFGIPEAAVEDILQDVFVVVHRKLAEYEGRRGVRTWLTRILVRVVREHQRRFRRKEDHDELPDDVAAPASASPQEAVAKRQAVAILQEILAGMNEDQRFVFVLAEVEQVPVPEIAEALSLSPNTVYSRLRLARRTYQREVARVCARDGWRLES